MICDKLPRTRLVHLPTPLEHAQRLSDKLGVEMFVKREDLAGLCAGGNKARLMEFVIGALQAKGVDTLVATSAPQSNKLREIAAAAARCGLRCVLLLPETPDGVAPQGNRLLFELLGAEVRRLEPGLDDAALLAAQEAVCDELTSAGRRPAMLDRRLDYGLEATLAYVDAAEELANQLHERSITAQYLYLTVGAGMTVAGMALGFKYRALATRVTGVCVARSAGELRGAVVEHAGRAAERLGIATRLEESDVELVDDYVAPGYGIVTPRLRDTVRTVAGLHGMVLDPVYNAKTALALLDAVAGGDIVQGATVILVNTGGAPGIYPHNRELQAPS